MTNEAKIILFGCIIISMMVVMILLLTPATNKETNCRMYLAETTDRSLEEIQQLCKQP